LLAIVKLRALETVCTTFAVSVTSNVKSNVPSSVGMPNTSPVEAFRFNPLGRDPDVMLRAYADSAEFPATSIVTRYGALGLPAGSRLVAIAKRL
jgi:hypothetical protein